MKRLRFSLTFSILAFLSCLLLLTWLLFSFLAYKTSANDLYAQRGEHAKMVLTTYVQQLPEIITEDTESTAKGESPASLYARNLTTDTTFIRLTLLDSENRAILSVGKEGGDIYRPFAGSNRISKNSCNTFGSEVRCINQVMRQNRKVATAGIIFSLADANARINRSQTLIMAYFAIDFILLLAFGAFILSRMVISPLNRLLAATEKIANGHYGQKIHISGSAELAQLVEAFNDMSQNLHQKEEQVQQHLAALQNVNSELRSAREEAVRTEKMASIGLLAAGMAHEIGSPLAATTGYAELLTTEELDTETVKDYARRISIDCNRIDKIVRGLLDYARPPHNSTVEKCCVPELIQETVELLKSQGVLKKVMLDLQFNQELSVVAVNAARLQQVLINLIINASDAITQQGWIRIHAKNSVTDTSQSVVQISITDNGHGIAPEHIKQIFDPFFTTKEPGKGTGLGLAISARIIEGFGGTIAVTSELHTGTTFSLTLPGVIK